MCYPLGTIWHPNWKAHGKNRSSFYMPLSDLASVFLHSALRGLPPVVAAENTRDDVRCLHWLSSFPENHQATPKRRGLKSAYYTILPTQIYPNNALIFLDQSLQITMDHTSSIVSSLHNMDTLIESRPKCSGTFYALKSVAEILKVPSTIPS